MMKNLENKKIDHEKIIYYFLEMDHMCKDLSAKKIIDLFKQYNSVDRIKKEMNKMKSSDSIDEHYKKLFLFLEFIESMKRNNINKAYMILEKYYSDEELDLYFLMTLIFGYSLGMDVENFLDILDIEDELIKKIFLSYKLYFQGKYNSSYKIIASISYIQRYKMIIELILLLNLIKLNIIQEAENLIKEFILKNKQNILFNLIYAEILFIKGDIKQSLKIYEKYKNELLSQILRENYLVLLLNYKKIRKWIKCIEKYKKLEDEDYFFIAKYYHKNGFLDLAYENYKKLDPMKFPVNKMLGIIYFQMNQYDKAVTFLKKDIELRGEDLDVKKILKYLQLKYLLKV